MRLFRRRRDAQKADLEAARRARHEAERELAAIDRDLDRTRAQTPQYRAIGESLRELREENHIALQLRLIFRGGTQHGHQ